MIRILVVPVGRSPEVRDIDPSLEAMQGVVGGDIEAVTNLFDSGLDLYCNGTGKIDGLTPNRLLTGPGGTDVVCGDFFISKADDEGEPATLSDDDVKTAYRLLAGMAQVMTPEELIKEFQCPGCVCGPDPSSCSAYKPDLIQIGGIPSGVTCEGHVLGTMASTFGNFALGLPKGFNRPGPNDARTRSRNKMLIRLWPKSVVPAISSIWDNLNLATWALEQNISVEGVEKKFLFVRTYIPRINDTAVDVVEEGTLSLVPKALDVGQFIDDID